MNSDTFEKIYRKCLKEENLFSPQKPISSQEELRQALWYICDQFGNMANSLRGLISEKLTEASFNNNYISDGLKQYSKTRNEIRKCQKNISRTIVSIRNWLQNNNTPIDHNSPMFDDISAWTHSVIKFSNTYIKYNKNKLLPSIENYCQMYAESISNLNNLIDDLNNIENAQQIDHIVSLPNNLLR